MVGKCLTTGLGLVVSTSVFAITIQMESVSGENNFKPIGTIEAVDTQYGLLLTPNLTNLAPGIHGMHLHEAPLCDNHGQAAMGHFDPKKTDKHLGPYNDGGHLGDLPALTVEKDGSAKLSVLAPRLTVKDIEGHSVIIHEGGDNYSDTPKLGGGGDRVACGIVGIEAQSKR